MIKKCTKCKEEKSIEEFTTKTGNIKPRCKKCLAEDQLEWLNRNKEKVNARKKKSYHDNIDHTRELSRNAAERFRKENPEGKLKIQAKYRGKNREVLREKGREYVKRTIKDRGEYLKNARFRWPEKYKARQAVQAAVKKGDLVVPSRCQWCNEERKLEGHHASYAPEDHLEVVWVCRICHRAIHKMLKERKK